jgi:outer membrane lipoprotein-sorting protein
MTNKNIKGNVQIIFLILLVAWPGFSAIVVQAAPPPGETPAEQGLHIFNTQDDMNVGYIDSEAKMYMKLYNAAGQESRREMLMRFLEVPEDADKTLITFHFPRDIKGTGLLTFEHIERGDDQWLYLPAVKRVKRIASENKSGSFVGSEFSYEDISSTKPEKYTYNYLREDMHDGKPVWVTERFPKAESSGYTKIVSWVDQSNFQTVKQEFFDRKGALLKEQYVKGLTLYLDKYWRPREVTMDNLQTKKKTILEFLQWEFQQGLRESLFTKRSLERQR